MSYHKEQFVHSSQNLMLLISDQNILSFCLTRELRVAIGQLRASSHNWKLRLAMLLYRSWEERLYKSCQIEVKM